MDKTFQKLEKEKEQQNGRDFEPFTLIGEATAQPLETTLLGLAGVRGSSCLFTCFFFLSRQKRVVYFFVINGKKVQGVQCLPAIKLNISANNNDKIVRFRFSESENHQVLRAAIRNSLH